MQKHKGVQDCRIQIPPTGPRLVSLIGLNESGKTTILEALNQFVARDVNVQKLYEASAADNDPASFVPRSKQLNFNEQIDIEAKLVLSDEDIAAVADACKEQGYTLITENKSRVVTVNQLFHYLKSKHVDSTRTYSPNFSAKKKNGSKIERIGGKHPCWPAYWKTLASRLPQICYFPTFLFNFPDKILLEEHADEDPVNAYYRQLVQDIFDSLDQSVSVKEHFIDRVRGTDGSQSYADFEKSEERNHVNHLFLRASAKVTAVVLQSWKRVFHSDLGDKRVEIKYELDSDTDNLVARFYLIDGDELYKIGDRSLGFRWFFCFWLFTYFRTLRSGDHGVIFLIDEPASNLHARAQEEILQNLETLASGKNTVLYSTHSHYLVSPKWLDRAYIVSNGSFKESSVATEFTPINTNITALPYKQFAGKHPSQRDYFLPVLHALDYRPSELTLAHPSLIVEGKADYAFLQSAFAGIDLGFSIVPGGGAKSLGPIIALLAGWGFPVACLLDADKEGRDARDMYIKNWGLATEDSATIAKFEPSFEGKSLEKILLEQLNSTLKAHFANDAPTKEMAQDYLHEALAKGQPMELTPTLQAFADKVRDWASARLIV